MCFSLLSFVCLWSRLLAGQSGAQSHVAISQYRSISRPVWKVGRSCTRGKARGQIARVFISVLQTGIFAMCSRGFTGLRFKLCKHFTVQLNTFHHADWCLSFYRRFSFRTNRQLSKPVPKLTPEFYTGTERVHQAISRHIKQQWCLRLGRGRDAVLP